MATQRAPRTTSPGDSTGIKAEKLKAEAQAELKKRDGEIALARALEQERKDEVHDLVDGGIYGASNVDTVDEVVVDDGDEDDVTIIEELKKSDDPAVKRLLSMFHRQKARAEADIETQGVVNVDDATVVIRVNADIEQMTLGVGNHYNFEAGSRYRVPIHVARHLEEKGLVWH